MGERIRQQKLGKGKQHCKSHHRDSRYVVPKKYLVFHIPYLFFRYPTCLFLEFGEVFKCKITFLYNQEFAYHQVLSVHQLIESLIALTTILRSLLPVSSRNISSNLFPPDLVLNSSGVPESIILPL